MFKDIILFEKESEIIKKLELDILKIRFNNKIRKGELNIIESNGDNRKLLENKDLDVLVSPEKNAGKDFMHYRNSGLNQVLCEIARKNNMAIGFSFNEVLNSKERGKLLGRMMLNVRLCRKYKVKMLIGSFARNEFELRSFDSLITFGKIIGMNEKEARNALSLIDNIKE
ncbi:MAG TPA: RNase P subunit p30 family protein [Candidatus Nanoarchaeia archaeon]|nr:RNase P subunit p30 family protein [Candidatus Nanoarchaeia archaeon]